MKRRWLVWMAGLAALSPLAAMSPGCSQPKPECTVGSASAYPFVTTFTLVDGDPESPCARKDGTVELVGMQVYNPNANGDQLPDRETKIVAIQTEEFGRWYRGEVTVDPNPDLNAFAIGAFAALDPDDNNICTVPTLAAAEVVVQPGDGGAGGEDGAGGEGGEGGAGDGGAGGEGGAGDGGAGGAGDGGAGGAGDGGAGGAGGGAGGSGGAGEGGAGGAGGAGGGSEEPVCIVDQQPPPPPPEPGSYKLEWSNVRVYVTASNLGNQFDADLTYSEESCTARYKVVGLWPMVDCRIYEEDPTPDCPAVPTDKVDQAICQDPLSGISPDLKVKCDTNAGLCVLDAQSIPALK
ncbi:hypothetical protein WMF30_28525 [Sorangium sp. So ce134]